MAAVKGRGNKSTEIAFLRLLRQAKITGWRRHYKKLEGIPDFVFPKKRLAIFIDGCFWHGCKKHSSQPKTNKLFWREKILKNMKRDRNVNRKLRGLDWKVRRVWEHELSPQMILNTRWFSR